MDISLDILFTFNSCRESDRKKQVERHVRLCRIWQDAELCKCYFSGCAACQHVQDCFPQLIWSPFLLTMLVMFSMKEIDHVDKFKFMFMHHIHLSISAPFLQPLCNGNTMMLLSCCTIPSNPEWAKRYAVVLMKF